MEWIHCNSCFTQPNENVKKQFFLTSCGHIFCENCGCFVKDTSDCCKHCNNKCSSTLIGEKTFRSNPQVLEYFQVPEEACEKLLKVIKFQKAHRQKLVAHHERILSKYNRAKLYIKKLETELKNAKNALRNKPHNPYNGKVNTETQPFSTPIFHPNSTPFNMIDAVSKIYNSSSVKTTFPDMRHRKQSLRNELSILSSGTGTATSGIRTPNLSIYESPLQERSNENNIPTLDNFVI